MGCGRGVPGDASPSRGGSGGSEAAHLHTAWPCIKLPLSIALPGVLRMQILILNVVDHLESTGPDGKIWQIDFVENLCNYILPEKKTPKSLASRQKCLTVEFGMVHECANLMDLEK